jgi:hypothetical protein
MRKEVYKKLEGMIEYETAGTLKGLLNNLIQYLRHK